MPNFGQVTNKVITMEMLGRIRRMYLHDTVSLHEIAKRTGLSRNTVRRWLRKPQEVEVPTYSRTAGFSKLIGFVGELEQSLKADAPRPKRDRRTAPAPFVKIKATGYADGYTQVTDYIHAWRASAVSDHHPFSCGLAGKAVLSKDFQDARRKFSVKFNKTGNINFLIVLTG